MFTRALILSLAILTLIAVKPSFSVQGVCGDLNGSGSVDIADLVLLIEYFRGTGTIVMENAEFDDRVGVTIGDFCAWSDAICEKSPEGLFDCNPTQSYSFAPAPSDTLYVPYRFGINAGATEVYLPVGGTFDLSTGGFYLPLVWNAAGANGTFELTYVHAIDDVLGQGPPTLADTAVLLGSRCGCFPQTFDSRGILYSLHYTRSAAGIGDIATAAVDRSDDLRIAVEKEYYDLFIPEIVEVDVSLPIGDCNCDGFVNVTDVSCLVGYLFEGQPVCQPYLQPFGVQIQSVDCNDDINVSDLTYLVAYLFQGGPEPCNPFAP